MSIYKIYVNDRNYTSWDVFDTSNFEKINLDINPIELKLFSNDVFTIEDGNVKLLHSTIQSTVSIPGVLVLLGNKTYGRDIKEGLHKKKRRQITL